MSSLGFSILALSGSLRTASINSAFCRTVARLAPPPIRVSVHEGLGDLPLFNPDIEPDPPAVVTGFRSSVSAAHAILIASPEYAHGVSGVMKNALDWLVSFEGAVGKRVALVNTSPRAHHAYDSLAEVLRTMSMEIVPGASLAIPLLGYLQTTEQMTASPEVREAVRTICEALAAGSR